MKNLPITLVLLCLLLFIISCNNESAPSADAPKEEETEVSGITEEVETNAASTKDTISLNTYMTWRANWENNGATWLASDSLVGFNLPLIDLASVLGENPKPDSSRFYLGLESDGSGGYNAKLMVVGVRNGRDMIDYANGHYVYDLSTPCPPFCGN